MPFCLFGVEWPRTLGQNGVWWKYSQGCLYVLLFAHRLFLFILKEGHLAYFQYSFEHVLWQGYLVLSRFSYLGSKRETLQGLPLQSLGSESNSFVREKQSNLLTISHSLLRNLQGRRQCCRGRARKSWVYPISPDCLPRSSCQRLERNGINSNGRVFFCLAGKKERVLRFSRQSLKGKFLGLIYLLRA